MANSTEIGIRRQCMALEALVGVVSRICLKLQSRYEHVQKPLPAVLAKRNSWLSLEKFSVSLRSPVEDTSIHVTLDSLSTRGLCSAHRASQETKIEHRLVGNFQKGTGIYTQITTISHACVARIARLPSFGRPLLVRFCTLSHQYSRALRR